MSADTLTSRIAAFARHLDPAALPREVVTALRLAVLDCVAATLSGVTEYVSQCVVARVAAANPDATGPCRIVGRSAGAGPEGAALANGTMGHACDFDDSGWSMWGHPTAPILPAILAVADARGLSGLDLLASLAVGLETEKALGLAIQPEHYRTGWHPTGTLGVFGAAAAAGKALGLDAEPMRAALGIAASRSAGIRANVGTMTKPLHVGFAARDGLEAALLAEAGVSASAEALEGANGFLAVYAPEHRDTSQALDRLGDPFEAVDPGLVYKLYPCCADLHASIDAMLDLRSEHGLAADDVRAVRCGITPMAADNAPYPMPETPLQAKFSQEYVLAAALARGRVGLADFEQGAILDSEVRELIGRVQVSVLPELSGPDSVAFASPARVEVETVDGRVLGKTVREPRGHPNRPLSAEDLTAKFVDCASRVLVADAVDRSLALIGELDRLADVRDLTRELTRARPDLKWKSPSGAAEVVA